MWSFVTGHLAPDICHPGYGYLHYFWRTEMSGLFWSHLRWFFGFPANRTHMLEKQRVHRASRGANATECIASVCSWSCYPWLCTNCRFFQSCNFQDGITPVVAVQIEDDDSIFTKILVTIPVNVIEFKQGFKLIPKICLQFVLVL